MDIKELKQLIELNKPIEKLLILKYSDNNFIPHQYINKYRENNNYSVAYVDNLTDLLSLKSINIFNDSSDMVTIFETDNFTITDTSIKDLSNTIIITKKINKEYKLLFEDNLVEIPKLEAWQLNDYVGSLCEGLSEDAVSYIVNTCNSDIFRIDNECKKIAIFDKRLQENLVKEFKMNDVFSDLSSNTVFDLSNALITRDKVKLSNVLRDIKNIDCEPFQLMALLINNFRNIIHIQLGNNKPPEAIGISPKQYWAIKKYSIGYYEADKLVKIFKELTAFDKTIKNGSLDPKYVIDLICIKIMQIADSYI